MAIAELRRWMVLCYAFSSISLLTGAGEAQTFFTEVTEEAGVSSGILTTSAAFGDFDHDGWPDFLVTEAPQTALPPPPRMGLWHNERNGSFIRNPETIQEGYTGNLKGGGALFGDFDRDGDLDLFVPVGSWTYFNSDPNILFRNDRGIFQDISADAMPIDDFPTDNAIWLDYDRDGNIDLYTGNLSYERSTWWNKLYRNNGDGTFKDATEEAGLYIQFSANRGGTNGGMGAGDFNNDGWPDLYLGVWGNPNRLFLNDGQGRFLDVTTEEIGDVGRADGIAIGDINNDGNLDIFQAAGGGYAENPFRSLMLLNLGDGHFLDATESLGLSRFFGINVAGAGLADLDNDGDLDLVTAAPASLFQNNGDGTFSDHSSQAGYEGVGTVLAFGDYNLDGALDILFGQPQFDVDYLPGITFGKLYKNNGNENHWLRVELVGIESNRDGIGARLVTTSGDLQQTREIFGGLGRQQDEMIAHFGLGRHKQVDRLEIRWPSGQVDVLTDIPADQKIRVFEGRNAYHTIHPTAWETAPPDSMVVSNFVEVEAILRPALFEPGAQITRIWTDLSKWGGPADFPLMDLGDGRFSLKTTLMANSPHGFRELSVHIEQTTSLGFYWTKLSKHFVILPAEDLVIFSEGAVGEGELVPVSGAELNPQDETVYEGRVALALKSSSFTVKYQLDNPPNIEGFSSLRFAFHPGEATVGFKPTFTVMVNHRLNKAVNLLTNETEGMSIDMEVKDWQGVEIPLSTYRGRLEDVRFFGNLRGTFYLDDIRVVAATPPPSSTAITETHTVSLPQTFILFQNYPNPFNSATVIRFALPVGGDVELSIFNLAGQRVATLVQGAREAGTYTVRWDGRDDDGQALASGVYLYRLRTGDGQQVETWKLLLLR